LTVKAVQKIIGVLELAVAVLIAIPVKGVEIAMYVRIA
jgi:hypothetical protein